MIRIPLALLSSDAKTIDLMLLDDGDDPQFPFGACIVQAGTLTPLRSCRLGVFEAAFLCAYIGHLPGSPSQAPMANVPISCQLYEFGGMRATETLIFRAATSNTAIDVELSDSSEGTLATARLSFESVSGFIRKLGAHYGA